VVFGFFVIVARVCVMSVDSRLMRVGFGAVERTIDSCVVTRW